MRRELIAATLIAATAAPSLPAQPVPNDSAVVAFLRQHADSFLKRMSVPGAVVTFVRDGRVVMNQGFGYADVAKKIVFSADSTVIRTASMAKVITSIAALQQVNAGALSLTDDIRRRVPELDAGPAHWPPVTLRNLLTHTGGFDEQYTGYATAPGEAPAPLSEYIVQNMPARTRPENDVPGYSNHGYGLIGLLVERASGIPFDRYARERVFQPLGMHHTSFMMRPGTGDAPNQAVEYHSSGEIRVQRATRAYPAGNLATTGSDMARLLIELVSAMRADARTTVIAPAMLAQLAGPQLVYHPELPPMGLGFSGQPFGRRVVWIKAGSGPSHSGVIVLFPESRAALFVALNRQEPIYWERMLPGLAALLESDQPAQSPARASNLQLDGDYQWTRISLANWEKFLAFDAQIRVKRDTGGVLVTGPFVGRRWAQIGPTSFLDTAGNVLAFRVDSAGRATHVFSVDIGQPFAFERIPLHQTNRVQLGTLLGATLISLTGAILTLARNRSPSRGGTQPTWARAGTLAVPLAQIATVGAMVAVGQQGGLDKLLEGPTSGLYATLSFTTLTAAASIWQAAGSATLATRSETGVATKTVYWLGSAAGVGMLWFLGANNLIGFQF